MTAARRVYAALLPGSPSFDQMRLIALPFMINPGLICVAGIDPSIPDRIITEHFAPEKMKLAFAGGIIFNTFQEQPVHATLESADRCKEDTWTLNNPKCPTCGFVFPWLEALKQILGPSRKASSLWGALCPECGADLKVPLSRVLLIAASGIFFGSQTSTLLRLGDYTAFEFLLAMLWLIVGFYAIAIFIFLRLEPVE